MNSYYILTKTGSVREYAEEPAGYSWWLRDGSHLTPRFEGELPNGWKVESVYFGAQEKRLTAVDQTGQRCSMKMQIGQMLDLIANYQTWDQWEHRTDPSLKELQGRIEELQDCLHKVRAINECGGPGSRRDRRSDRRSLSEGSGFHAGRRVKSQ